jgi:hypothetical protein
MNKVITIDNFLNEKEKENEPTKANIKEWMIEFAKLHVNEALKQASEKFSINLFGPDINEVRKDILNAYSLDNVE